MRRKNTVLTENQYLQDVKAYLGIDLDYLGEDTLVSSLILSGEEYLKNAGVKVGLENNLYNIVLKMVVSQLYEGRVDGSKDKNPSFCLSLQSLISQLVYLGGGINEKN